MARLPVCKIGCEGPIPSRVSKLPRGGSALAPSKRKARGSIPRRETVLSRSSNGSGISPLTRAIRVRLPYGTPLPPAGGPGGDATNVSCEGSTPSRGSIV